MWAIWRRPDSTPVVEVGGEIGDLVGKVDDLGFERRALVEEVGGELGVAAAV